MSYKFKRIYLQYKDEDGNNIDPKSGEMTWCREKINDSDVEYVLASSTSTEREWIAVEDRLPETILPVLAFADGVAYVATFWFVQFPEFMHNKKPLKNVTHWCELPAPPKQEQQGE